ncbi:hypothetical protein EV426DRAFT_9653 [Tirmania nivea]|nr:hypothetical protein EV426DRAFT_9653 [Tirmania nivea]
MATAQDIKNRQSLLSTPLHGLYIPAGLIVFGTAIIKTEWTHYAAGVAALLMVFKVYRGTSRRVLKAGADWQEFELKEKTEISHNVAIYRFALPRKNDILGLPIGQHVSLSATIDGKEIVRSYTPVSNDAVDRGYFDLLIKSYPTGNISKYVANMKVGETIKARGPKGQMVYTPGLVRAFGMISGGTGITPMLQIIRAILMNDEDNTKVDLIFANVGVEDILLREELDELVTREQKNGRGRLKVYYVLNNPPEGWAGGVGFVTADMIKACCPAPAPDVKILLCGPPPMMSAMKKACTALGYTPAKPVSKLADQVFCF